MTTVWRVDLKAGKICAIHVELVLLPMLPSLLSHPTLAPLSVSSARRLLAICTVVEKHNGHSSFGMDRKTVECDYLATQQAVATLSLILLEKGGGDMPQAAKTKAVFRTLLFRPFGHTVTECSDTGKVRPSLILLLSSSNPMKHFRSFIQFLQANTEVPSLQ